MSTLRREAARRARNLLTDFLSEVGKVAASVQSRGGAVEKIKEMKDALTVR